MQLPLARVAGILSSRFGIIVIATIIVIVIVTVIVVQQQQSSTARPMPLRPRFKGP